MSSIKCDLYEYAPSTTLSVIGVIAFSGLASALCLRVLQTRTWSGVFFVLGAICKIPLEHLIYSLKLTLLLVQMSGYTARLFSSLDACNKTPYGIQSIFLLLGPTLIMFSVNLSHIQFSKTLGATEHSFIPIRWQEIVVLPINIILGCLQATGGIMTVASTSIATITIGTKITIAIYVVQIVFWGVLFADNVCMAISLGRVPTEACKESFATWKTWNQLFGLSTSIIAFGRNVMRLTMAGGIAFLVDNEWPSYAFDGYQMIVVLLAWGIWYLPGKCKVSSGSKDYRALVRLSSAEHGV